MRAVPGFSFIELMVSLVITSILSLLLYNIFYQTQRSTKTIQSMMDYTILVPTVYNQLEKDCTALFIPQRALRELADKNKKKKATTVSQGSVKKPQKEPKKEEKKVKPIQDLFVLKGTQERLESLSFIATNSLSLYNTVVPRYVRVLYRLVPQAGGKLFRLTRQETTDITLNHQALLKSQKVRSYDLIRHIEQLSVSVLVPEKQPKQKSDKESADQPDISKPLVYKNFTQWDPEKMMKELKALVPAFIIFSGVIVDPLTGRKNNFEWRFGVAGFNGIAEQLKRIESAQKPVKKETQQKSSKKSDKKTALEKAAQKPIIKGTK